MKASNVVSLFTCLFIATLFVLEYSFMYFVFHLVPDWEERKRGKKRDSASYHCHVASLSSMLMDLCVTRILGCLRRSQPRVESSGTLWGCLLASAWPLRSAPISPNQPQCLGGGATVESQGGAHVLDGSEVWKG